MEVLRDGMDRVPEGTATAVSVGSYDGIHRGHHNRVISIHNRQRQQCRHIICKHSRRNRDSLGSLCVGRR